MSAIPPNIPGDMAFMLGQIDAKLGGIQNTLSAIIQRADGHEARLQGLEGLAAQRAPISAQIADLEARVNDLEASRDQAKGGFSASRIFTGLLGAILMAVIMLGGEWFIHSATSNVHMVGH